ncbi:hypothetical protein KCU90_g4570, partial [Aureobasidium melanogenum]
LRHRTRTTDHGADVHRVGPVEDQRTVIDDVAAHAARRPAIADLQRPSRVDRRAAAHAVVAQRPGDGQRATAHRGGSRRGAGGGYVAAQQPVRARHGQSGEADETAVLVARSFQRKLVARRAGGNHQIAVEHRSRVERDQIAAARDGDSGPAGAGKRAGIVDHAPNPGDQQADRTGDRAAGIVDFRRSIAANPYARTRTGGVGRDRAVVDQRAERIAGEFHGIYVAAGLQRGADMIGEGTLQAAATYAQGDTRNGDGPRIGPHETAAIRRDARETADETARALREAATRDEIDRRARRSVRADRAVVAHGAAVHSHVDAVLRARHRSARMVIDGAAVRHRDAAVRAALHAAVVVHPRAVGRCRGQIDAVGGAADRSFVAQRPVLRVRAANAVARGGVDDRAARCVEPGRAGAQGLELNRAAGGRNDDLRAGARRRDGSSNHAKRQGPQSQPWQAGAMSAQTG